MRKWLPLSIGLAVVLAALALSRVRADVAQAASQKPVPPPERFTVPSDGHPMAVWARRPASPRGVVLLLHGRTWSSLPDFDLQVPGMQRSVMMSLAAQGFAAYAVDMRGYGGTPRDASGWLTPKRSAADALNVLAWVAEQYPTLPRPALVGWSRGAAVAQLAAQSSPSRMSALVLFGFAFDPDSQFLDTVVPGKPQMLKNTVSAAMSDFMSPKVTPQAMTQAFTEQALRTDPVLADLKGDAEFNALKPSRVIVPTLVLFGERDLGVLPDEAGKFFAKLATPDKQMISLAGGDHAALIEDTHDAWIHAVVSFLTRPPVRR
jgi:alpha-beta hydrolase superfamily lysophospholipase